MTKCRIGCDKRCQIHNCEAKKITVTSKVWKYIDKKKEYGYGAVRRTKIICKSEKDTREDQDISTPTRNLARDKKSVGLG